MKHRGLVCAVGMTVALCACGKSGGEPAPAAGSAQPAAATAAATAAAAAPPVEKMKKADLVKLAQASGRPARPPTYKPKLGEKVLAGWRTGEWDSAVVYRITGTQVFCAYEDSRGQVKSALQETDVLPRPTPKDAEMPQAGRFVIANVSPTLWVYARVKKVDGADVHVEYVPGMGWEPTALESKMVRAGELVLVK